MGRWDTGRQGAGHVQRAQRQRRAIKCVESVAREKSVDTGHLCRSYRKRECWKRSWSEVAQVAGSWWILLNNNNPRVGKQNKTAVPPARRVCECKYCRIAGRFGFAALAKYMLSLSTVTSDSPGITIRGHISYTNKTGRDKRILRGAAGSAGPRASQQFLCLRERPDTSAPFSQKLASCVQPQGKKGKPAILYN